MRLGPSVATAFAALHLGYGVGLIVGAAELGGARLRGRQAAGAVSRR